MLRRLKEMGYDGVEIPLFSGDDAYYDKFGAKLRDIGLGVTTVGVVDRKHNPGSPNPTIRKRGVNYLKNRVRWTNLLGGKVFCGPVGALPWGVRPKVRTIDELANIVGESMKHGIESMREVGDYASELGVEQVAIEPLTHWELPGMNTVQTVCEFLKQVKHPSITALVDSSHEVLDGAGPTEFQKCVEEIIKVLQRRIHVHASATHRGSLRYTWINWNLFFLLLLKAGWDGDGSGIVATEEFDAVPPFLNGVKLTRPRFTDLFAVAEESLKVVREGFDNAKAILESKQSQGRYSKLEIAALA